MNFNEKIFSSQIKTYTDTDYSKSTGLVPHGLSVVMTAPADFQFTVHACPDKHFDAARILGADLPETSSPDVIGNVLADILRGYMKEFNIPNGLSALGADRQIIDKMADAAMFYLSKDRISPRKADKEAVAKLYEQSMSVY